jgi:hypothetical protein
MFRNPKRNVQCVPDGLDLCTGCVEVGADGFEYVERVQHGGIRVVVCVPEAANRLHPRWRRPPRQS